MFFSISSVEQLAIPVTILVVYLVLVAFARPDRDDERGDGLYASYLGVVGVVSLYTVLLFGVIAVATLGELVLVDRAGGSDEFNGISQATGVVGLLSGFGSGTTDEQTKATFVLATSLAGAAAIAFAYHSRRRSELEASDGYADSAAARVDRAYRAAVAFVAVTLGIIAVGFIGDAVYQLVTEPSTQGVTPTVVRDRAAVELVSFGLLLVVVLTIFRSAFWAIRGVDDEGDDELVEMGE